MGEASGSRPGLSAREQNCCFLRVTGLEAPHLLELGSSLRPLPVDGAGPDIRVHVAGVGVRQIVAHDTARLTPGGV